MSTNNHSLPNFFRAHSKRFLRYLIGLGVVVGILAFPAETIILLFAPEALGYTLIAMGSLVIALVGVYSGYEGDEELDEEAPEPTTRREFIISVAIWYALYASGISLLLVVAGLVGLGLASVGFPLAAIVVVAVLPYLDRAGARVDVRLSLVNIGFTAALRVLRVVAALYSLPGDIADSARQHKRDIY